MKNRKNFWAYLAWISLCIIWGTTFLAIKVGVKDLPPLLFAGLRWLIAGSILLAILKIKGIKLPQKKDFIHIIVQGILLLGIANGFVVAAEQWIPSGLTALLLATTPFIMFGLEMILPQGPKFNLTVLGGLLCGFFGIIIIFYNKLTFLFDASNLLGLGFLFIAVIAWALGTVYSKYKKTNTAPLMRAAFQMLVAGTGQLLIGIVLGEYHDFVFTTASLLAFLYLVIVASILGYGSYIYAISKLPISFVSTHSYINTVIALFLGWLILNEKIDLQVIIGAAIILIGVFLVKREISKKN